ncbi:MAG TPA: polyprenol monophosphomannose synthase [Candidatus Paceibacterota bacterium]|nr:polyprenol monophosphomannose synthase [Candidatus Paceibacterota bacterium]
MKMTILIPTYNEAGNIESLLERISEYVPDANILVIDDNSPDGTGAIVAKIAERNPRVHLLARERKEGLGRAYMNGFTEVLKDPSVEMVVIMDADFSHDPSYIPEMIRAASRADVVIASRYCKGGALEGWTTWRRWLSRFANGYCRAITGLPVHDTTAGFILIKTALLRKAGITHFDASGYAFLMELKYRLWRDGAQIAEVPITFKERREGISKISSNIIFEGVMAPWKLRFKGDA